MPNKIALVNYGKCQPKECNAGKCAAAAACTRKLLKQEVLFEPPIPHPSLCKACGDCVRACPFNAIEITRG
ncbi:MAG: 4Fe-4S binding protein [Chloroflexota bacterium]